MDLIIGGAYQGKLTLAAREYGLTPGDICDLAAGEPALGARCYIHLEELTRRQEDTESYLPLLTAAEDYAALGRALMEALPAQRADTAVLYMGHGSEHQANSAYALMEYAFHDLGRKDVVIGTVEGYPGFGEALRRLKERPQVRRVELRPLRTVAGDHAKNDLAGDEEDSWRRRLEAEGYETVCVLTGLGEHPAVRALFVEHARQAEQLQAEAC